VRSRPHALHVVKRLRPLTACGIFLQHHRVCTLCVTVCNSAVVLRDCFVRPSMLRSTYTAHLSFSFSYKVGSSRSRFHGPPSSFPVPTGHSLMVHLCTSHLGASLCIQRRPSSLRCAWRDVGPRHFSDQCLLILAYSVLVLVASFIKIVQPLQIATDVSVPPSPGASHIRLPMNNSDRRVAIVGPRRGLCSTVCQE
jgi:hypothetical protein